ncbi:hypothetical protein [Pseudomonas paeninsulae]|uniref:hypothetical protein n=1 Tax=Pseudomonas paeninsulae TaxID=3110772 RepID=UPI002D79E865|nr:hypothetical protein [Pseudomonas sp. IT1137]
MIDLSTVAGKEISNPPWVKFQSAGWVNFPSAPTQVLNLAYNAARVSIDCVEEVLSKFEIEVGHGWWTHFKEGHYRFVDQNIKDNAAHQPWSCHQTPPGTKRKP